MRFAIIAVILGTSGAAYAQDIAANIGVLQVRNLPGGENLGMYPYVGPSVMIKTKHVTLVPGLSLEWAPETDRWGFVGTFVTDFPIASHVGLDLLVAAGTDWSGMEREGLYFGGAGGGCSIFIEQWTVSPFGILFQNLNIPGHTFVPGLNISYSF